MTINGEIDVILEEAGMNIDNQMDTGKLYLLALYHGLDTSVIPEVIVRKVNHTKICERDYGSKTIKWNTPLFDTPGMVVDTGWAWVTTEFRDLFYQIRKDAAGDPKSVMKKMKKFFSEHPEVRKDEVIAAANLYLSEFRTGSQNSKYLQKADYFISKQDAGIVSSRLEQYLEIVKKEEEKGQERYKVNS